MSIAGRMRLSTVSFSSDLHVARAFELFKDNVVHARAGVDERWR